MKGETALSVRLMRKTGHQPEFARPINPSRLGFPTLSAPLPSHCEALGTSLRPASQTPSATLSSLRHPFGCRTWQALGLSVSLTSATGSGPSTNRRRSALLASLRAPSGRCATTAMNPLRGSMSTARWKRMSALQHRWATLTLGRSPSAALILGNRPTPPVGEKTDRLITGAMGHPVPSCLGVKRGSAVAVDDIPTIRTRLVRGLSLLFAMGALNGCALSFANCIWDCQIVEARDI